MTTPPGVFKGGIDLANGQLRGTIALPDVVSSQSVAGPVAFDRDHFRGFDQPVTGTVNIGTLQVKSTSTFNIHIKSMYVNQPSLR